MDARTLIRLTRSALCASMLGMGSSLLALTPPSGVAAQSSLAQLSFVGLPADRLLAAGLSAPQILGAAQRLRDAGTQLEELDAALGELAAAQASLKAILAQSSDGADAGSNTAAESARTLVAERESRVNSMRAQLRQVVLADASPEHVSMLARALDGAQIGLDGALSLAGEDDAAQHKLAVALQAEARSIRIGEELDPGYRELLAGARALAHVAAAQARMTADWPSLQAALSAPPTAAEP